MMGTLDTRSAAAILPRMRYALAIVALIGACSAALAQPADPYADGVAQAAKQRRQRRHDDFMDRVETLSYAVGCKVVAPSHAESAIFYSWFAQAKALGFEQPNITKEEMAETLNRSSQLAEERGCELWKNNPDLVLEFRQSVDARRMP